MSTWISRKSNVSSLTHYPYFCSFSLVLTGLLATVSMSWGADLSQAVVREKVNIVTLAPNLQAQARPGSARWDVSRRFPRRQPRARSPRFEAPAAAVTLRNG